MEVSSRDDSEYRILVVQNRIRYLTITRDTSDRRDPSSGEVAMNFQHKELTGIIDLWHPVSVDCLVVKRTKQLTATTYETTYSGDALVLPAATVPSSTVVIAKNYTGLAPRFISHVHEHGHVIGFMLKRLEGRAAGISDLTSCQSALQRLHDINIIYGDVNRYNSLIQGDTARVIDFKNSRFCNGATATASIQAEMDSLRDQLVEETGRAAGFAR
ncbi:hypothetical protein BJY00DRAFT_322318 [Aspergillus carlsbadensis]|nr:hypothetical protein BJY00DRAFT_322318 [Aspergillus carlsbadensis]